MTVVSEPTTPSTAPPTPRVRRKPSSRPRAGSQAAISTHLHVLNNIRHFLKGRTCYDAFPVSFKVTVLDTKLEVKKALQCLLGNGIVSACLWNSERSCFAGVLTVSDFVHLMVYYYKNSSYDDAARNVETLRLENLRNVEHELGVESFPLLHISPDATLWDAARTLIQSHARRLPLLDSDTASGHELIVSVLTQYRLLRFIAMNCKDVQFLNMPLRQAGIGTYVKAGISEPMSESRFAPIQTARLDTPVFDVVHMFSEKQISAVPIIDESGVVLNLYETVDVIELVKTGTYYNLDMTIAVALKMRSPDFPGVIVCTERDSLGKLLLLLRERRVHRLVVVEGEAEEKQGGKRGRLVGIITLADVLKYLVGDLQIGGGPQPQPASPLISRGGSPSLTERLSALSTQN